MQMFAVAVFSWMAIEVLDMYLMFVKVWSAVRHYVLKACIFGWGFPVLVTAITLAVHYSLIGTTDGTDESLRMYPMYRDTGM